MEQHFDFTSSVLIPYFNFFLFVGVFYFFFRKPLSQMAQARRDKFLNASKEAAAALEAAQAQFKEIKSKFDSIDSELQSFKTQSEKLAKDEAAKMLAEGERLSAQIASETKRLAVDEIARARIEMRQEIVAAAMKAAEEKIEKTLPDSEKTKLMSRRIGDLRAYHV